MAYTVAYHGIEVTCDTVEDLSLLVMQIECEKPPIATTPTPPASTPAETSSAASTPPVNTAPVAQSATNHKSPVTAVIASLNRSQKSLIKLLVDTDGSVSDAEARKAVGLDNNQQLAGILAGISKRFKAAGLNNLVQSDITFQNGSRVYEYWMEENEDLDAVRRGLAMG